MVYLINGATPGPAIVADQGDTIEVNPNLHLFWICALICPFRLPFLTTFE